MTAEAPKEPRVTKLPKGASSPPTGLTKEEKEAAARARRRRPTTAEELLWERISGSKLDGFSFVREKEILGWYADFYCAAARLVVEVDGRHHRNRRDEDNRRDEVMRANHYRVLRLPAGLVFNDLDEAVHRVRIALDSPWARRRRDQARRPPRSSKPAAEKREPNPDPIPKELTRKAPGKLNRRFYCERCDRLFSVDVNSAGWIECRRCHSASALKPICFSCKKPVDKVVSEYTWRCRRCSDVHDVARSAAGTGETPTGLLRDRRSRAQRWRP